jgi:hypothetical protein
VQQSLPDSEIPKLRQTWRKIPRSLSESSAKGKDILREIVTALPGPRGNAAPTAKNSLLEAWPSCLPSGEGWLGFNFGLLAWVALIPLHLGLGGMSKWRAFRLGMVG